MSITGKKYDVFISYAHRDGADIAEYLEIGLRRAGLSTFKDTTDILIGDVVIERLSEAISNSSYFIMVMTPSYFQSGWCKQESFHFLTSKLDRGTGAVLPILSTPCSIPDFIRPYKYFDLQFQSQETCLHAILNRIQRDIYKVDERKSITKFPDWVDEVCEIGSLARRSATHILRKENEDWHYKQLEDIYYKVCSIRTHLSARLKAEWDGLLEELQNSVYGFRGTEEDRERIERARHAIRDNAQRDFT